MPTKCTVIKNNYERCERNTFGKSCFCSKHRKCIAITKNGKRCRVNAGSDRLCSRHRLMCKVKGIVVNSIEYNTMISSANKIQTVFRPIIRRIINLKKLRLQNLWSKQHKEYRTNYLKYFIREGCNIPKFECCICFQTHRKRMPGCIDNEFTFTCNHTVCRSCALQMAYNRMNTCPLCRKSANVYIEIASTGGNRYIMLLLNEIFKPFMNKRIYINNSVTLTDDTKTTYNWKYGSKLVQTITNPKNIVCYTNLMTNSSGEHDFIIAEQTKERLTKLYIEDCLVAEDDDVSYPMIFIREQPDIRRIICAISTNDEGEIDATEKQINMFRSLFNTDAILLETDFSPIIVTDEDEDYTFNCYLTCLWSPLSGDQGDIHYESLDEIGENFLKDTIPLVCKIRNKDGYISRAMYVDDLQFVLNVSLNVARYKDILPKDIETRWCSYSQTLYMQNPSISECKILNEVTENTELKWVSDITKA